MDFGIEAHPVLNHGCGFPSIFAKVSPEVVHMPGSSAPRRGSPAEFNEVVVDVSEIGTPRCISGLHCREHHLVD